LVAFDEVLPRHDLFVLRAVVLLLDPRAALFVEPVEMDVCGRLGRGIDLHRNRDEPERNRRGGNCSWCHDALKLLLDETPRVEESLQAAATITRHSRSSS